MDQKQNPSYIDLIRTFFWIGLTAFGGAAGTNIIRKQIVDKKKWLDENTFDGGLALCQIIPGAIVMQLSAYIGLKVKGIRGAITSFISFGFPAFLVMFILSILYKQSRNIAGVEVVLSGLRIIIVAIVANAAYAFGKKNFYNVNDWLIAIIAAGLFYLKVYPALVVFIAGLSGLLLTNKSYNGPIDVVKIKTFNFFLKVSALVTVLVLLLYFINREYFTLATIMLRIDLFSFGGGMASMPIMYHELIDLYGWVDKKTFMDGVILGQVTPGTIIIDATFFGYLHLGVIGSVLATICVFTPSFLILMGIIPFFDKLRSYSQFNKVINGILCSFVGLLAVITYQFTLDIHWNIADILITVVAFVLLIRNVDVIWIILGGIIVSFLL